VRCAKSVKKIKEEIFKKEMAPKKTPKTATQKSASVSFVPEDVQQTQDQNLSVTEPVVGDIVEPAVENVDSSSAIETGPDGTSTKVETDILDTDIAEGDDDVVASTDAKKGLPPLECLREDLENLLEGATTLVAFSKDLESRLRKNLKTIYKIARKRNNGNSAAKDAPKRETNLTKQIKISEDMASFAKIEGDEASRTIIVKTISDYSKQNGLKLESDKRVIVLDDVLAKLMKKEVGDNVRFCDVQKFIKHHFV